ncbi:hypothetical protein Tco_0434647 [Tanacetum coccineum]
MVSMGGGCGGVVDGVEGTDDRGCGYFMWMDDLTLHISSSSGSSTPPSYSLGTSTRPSYFRDINSQVILGIFQSASIWKAECSNFWEWKTSWAKKDDKEDQCASRVEDSSNTNQWGKKEAGSSPSSSEENNQAVDNNVGDQEDPNVNDKQEVKKTDDQEIKNVKDEEGKNVEDQQVSEADDDTNKDDVGYMRQPIEDQDGPVRSIGVTVNSDVADFGSEVRDSRNLGVYELWKPSLASHIKTIMWFKKRVHIYSRKNLGSWNQEFSRQHFEGKDDDNNPSYDMDVDDELINAILYYSNHLDADDEHNNEVLCDSDKQYFDDQNEFIRDEATSTSEIVEYELIQVFELTYESVPSLCESFMDFDYGHHHLENMEGMEGEDTAFYNELTRQILLIMDEDDETYTIQRVNCMSRFERRSSIVSGGTYFSWPGSGRSIEVPSWMERLWAGNGGGTGVFIPRVVPPCKSRRRRNNKPKRNNNGVRIVHS